MGEQVLVLGFGNPGRLDDGLGPALAAALEREQVPGFEVDADYQLTVEDAARLKDYGAVIFADASVEGTAPFEFQKLKPSLGTGFSEHSVSPGALLALAQELFGECPPAYVLGIRGYDFNEFGEKLSERAQANLQAALSFMKSLAREELCRKENT